MKIRIIDETKVQSGFPTITEDELEWKATGPEENPESRLLTTIVVAGCLLHLEAYEVTYDSGQVLQTVAWPDDMSKVFEGLGVEEDLTQVEFEHPDGHKRNYILIAQPYGA